MIRRKLGAALAALAVVGLVAANPGTATANPKPAPAPSMQAHARVQTAAQKTALKGMPGQPAPITKGQPGIHPDNTSTLWANCAPNSCFNYANTHQLLTADPATSVTADYFIPAITYVPEIGVNNDIQSGGHSLGELSAQGVGTGGTSNIIEIGYTVDTQGVNGADHTSPHLFVFSWLNGVPQGYNGGNGYVDAVGCSPCAGDSVSGAGNTTKNLGITHNAVNNRWDLSYAGTVIGSYPDSSWSGAFTDFNAYQTFGEVATTDIDHPCGDMGSGALGGASPSATISNITLGGTAIAVSQTITQTDTTGTRYKVTQPSANSMRYGGPGWDSIGLNAGTRFSCASATAGTAAASSFQLWGEVCPDNQGVTGCTSTEAFPWASQTVGVCKVITNPGTAQINAVKNASGSSGKTFAVYRSGGCTGSALSFGNAVQQELPAGWDGNAIRAIRRTA